MNNRAESIVYSHVLTIGCTGMLRKAAVDLAGRCKTLTSIARTGRSLRALDAAIKDADCTHRMYPLDWSDPDGFIDTVATRAHEAGEADLVLAWLHDDALGPQLAQVLAPANRRCAFYQVRGSAAANPAARTGSFLQGHDIPATIGYHQIILGFHVDRDGSRWLHDDEICAGVLDAIAHPEPATTVGAIEPWTRHP